MKQVNIAEIKHHLSDYLKDVEAGNDVGICRRNILVARLTAVPNDQPAVNKTQLGCGKGTVIFMADLTEPLISPSEWNMFDNGAADETHS
jgi:antitoxin (DNA-binding transcriptional repressor) of toxin-antitoxin stability system